MRLLVEVPAQSFELTLAEVHSLRAKLHRRPKKSNFALTRACYARLHGVNPATSSHAFSSDVALFNTSGAHDAAARSVVMPLSRAAAVCLPPPCHL